LAFGYIIGKAASKVLDVDLNVPLVLAVSIISDIDLLIPHLEHRGPTHSFVVFSFLFLSSFLFYKKKTIPYFLASIQHSVLGDFFTGGGVQLFWPLALHWYGSGIEIFSLTNVFAEWTLFLMFLTVVFRTKDLHILFQRHTSNTLLSIPVLAIVLPVALGFPLHVPRELIIPHLACLFLFTVSILIDFKFIIKSFLK
jgi:membrane-bound metal-dependent hydrolase YbcI (DUF457 family)